MRVLTRDPAKVGRFGDKVQIAVGDLDKPETLAATVDGVQAVYLISQAGQAGLRAASQTTSG